MNIHSSLTELIGNTPLVELSGYARAHGLKARIVAKLEAFNPLSSVKDRVAYALLRDALDSGAVTRGTVLIEPTSGNTGVGLAFVAATLGMRLILVMPETMSVERRKLAAALGAELVLTEGAKGMQGAVDRAMELKAELGNAFIPQQFENPSNPKAHRETTGPEILRDTDGKLDAFVAGVGTGGTVSGVGEVLKGAVPGVHIIAVEPAASPLLGGGKPGPHKIQGIGANFIPKNYNASVVDEVLSVSNEDAFAAAREVARRDGVLCGVSSGAALHAAALLAKRPEFEGKTIVVLLPDTGERYLSTELFEGSAE